ncbi:MAG: hypothetical protein RIC35_22865 [Marinoscillum sp.]
MFLKVLLLTLNFQTPQQPELERISVGEFMELNFPINSLTVDTLVISGRAVKISNSIFGATEIEIDSMTNIQDIRNFKFSSLDSLRLFYDVAERKLRRSTKLEFRESQNVLIDSLEGRMIKFDKRTVYYVFGKNKLYQLLFELSLEDELDNLESELLGTVELDFQLEDQFKMSRDRTWNFGIYLIIGLAVLLVLIITAKLKKNVR